jgi:hypothetical protein
MSDLPKRIPMVLNLLLLASGVVFSVLLIELFLRINYKFGYTCQTFAMFKPKNATMPPLFNDLCLRPSDLLGYEPVPGCTTCNDKKVNSYGLMGKEYSLSKEKGTFRILLLGDSIAWWDWSRQDLEKHLNDDPMFASRKVEIWNASTPSYDVRRYFLYLKHRGLRYKPDMVLIFFCLNDFRTDINFYYRLSSGYKAFYAPLRETSKVMAVDRTLMQHSHLYRFFVMRLEDCLEHKRKAARGSELEDDGKFYLSAIKDLCDRNGILLYPVVFPYLYSSYDEYSPGQKEEYTAMMKVLD